MVNTNTYCIAITGTLESMTRDLALRQICTAGWKYSNSISQQTTHLIVGKDPCEDVVLKAVNKRVIMVQEEILLFIGKSPETDRRQRICTVS
jgi:NAD-dependent DNA ligase